MRQHRTSSSPGCYWRSRPNPVANLGRLRSFPITMSTGWHRLALTRWPLRPAPAAIPPAHLPGPSTQGGAIPWNQSTGVVRARYYTFVCVPPVTVMNHFYSRQASSGQYGRIREINVCVKCRAAQPAPVNGSVPPDCKVHKSACLDSVVKTLTSSTSPE